MASRPPVLFVDDELVTAQLYARAITKRGIGVAIGVGAEEGLRLAKELKPRVIVSDVQMPGMGGFDFCEALIKDGLKTCPVIFFTAHDDLDVLRFGLESGGDDFMIKGSQLNHIMERVTFWMGTGFLAMPQMARDRAHELVNEAKEDNTPTVAEIVQLDKKLLKELAQQAMEEVKTVGPDYGTRLVERIFFLGRLSHLVLEKCTTLGAVIRFPDYLMGAIAHVDFPWLSDLNILMKHFDYFSRDPRFKEAATKGLMVIS
jgi:DNA-binding response OmpR family regulator